MCSGGLEDGWVGREQETAVLEQALAEHRLVTVCGRAGVGKSRLAMVVTGAAHGSWRRVVRVRWRGGPGRPGALAAAVRGAWTEGRAPRGVDDLFALVRREEAGGVLLVLDDMDPVHRQCVGVVQQLLMASPRVRVLVTSRRALGVGEERVLTLAPLPTEVADGQAGPAPAVQLFVDRAGAFSDQFSAPRDLRAVESICRSLEGVPHAIELAAERVSGQCLHDLAALLEQRQCWLSSERPGLRRHRSVRDTVGASYLLCERGARMVWGRASMFAGAFDESAAITLCSSGEVESHRVPSLLAELAAIHVLEPVGDPGGLHPPRYRMTRAARDFGAERLREAGEYEAALERRAAHCRQITVVAAHLWLLGSQSAAVRLVHDEQEDLAAMVRHALAHPGQAETALEIVVGLWFWWAAYGRAEEGIRYLLRLLPLCPADSEVGGRGRWLAAWLSAGSDPQTARMLLGEGWQTAVLAGDDDAIGRIAFVQGLLSLHEGDAPTAAAHFHEAARTSPEQSPNGPCRAVCLAALAMAQSAFAPNTARRTVRRALAQRATRHDSWSGLVIRYAQALVEHRAGDNGRALHRAHRTLTAHITGGPTPVVCDALRHLITDIETGAPGHVHVLRVTLPPTPAASSTPLSDTAAAP
ncbi:hypothetical protein P8605_03060 [Streptomyces sp. T-3]|nr:hypothetical protein [Streptomyces sp. T-3]